MTRATSKLSIATLLTILLGAYLPAAFGHEVSLFCPAAFGTVPDASGLIAYYPLDGNTSDASGNGLDAIEVVAARPAEGKIGQGYYFNGKDSYIRLPLDISPYAYSQITLTAWIKAEKVKQPRYVINQGDYGNRSLFVYNGAVSAGRALIGNRKHTIYPNRWMFVALNYDQATNTAVLLSGGSFSALDKVGIPEQPIPSVLLGAKAPGNSVFAGVIDEVRIYDRALTTAELAALKSDSSPASVAVSNQPNQIPAIDGSNKVQPGQSANDDPAIPLFDTSSPNIFTSAPPEALSTDICGDVTCPTGQTCFDGGCFDNISPTLSQDVAAACANVTCPTDQACVDGGCFDNISPTLSQDVAAACTNVTCPDGQACVDGGCFDNAPDVFVAPAGSRQDAGSVPIALPGAEFGTASAQDIPTAPEYQAANQPVEYVAEGTMLMSDPVMPATNINAVMDLQNINIKKQNEKKGDEYYLVTYKVRGFRGKGTRVFTFDPQRQIMPLATGENWAKKNLQFSIPQAAGRLVFNNLKPFEIYGFVAVLMEANKNTLKEAEYAFGFGEYKNEAGVLEVISSAFARAVPNDAGRPDYDDMTCNNIKRIFDVNYNGIETHFGNYSRWDLGLTKAIRDAIALPLGGNAKKPDSFDGAFWGFSMNLPGGGTCLGKPPSSDLFPAAGQPFTYRTRSTRILGEHLQ
jgi:Concanavalin A-like lectin/glucanases superfamily